MTFYHSQSGKARERLTTNRFLAAEPFASYLRSFYHKGITDKPSIHDLSESIRPFWTHRCHYPSRSAPSQPPETPHGGIQLPSVPQGVAAFIPSPGENSSMGASVAPNAAHCLACLRVLPSRGCGHTGRHRRRACGYNNGRAGG